MPPDQPVAIVLAGINGAGKTTSSQALLADQLAVMSFVNADAIARGLNAFAPESVALQAGRVTLMRLRELSEEKADFAFETTLSGRTYLAFLKDLRENGYVVELYYFWLSSPQMAVERVKARVRRGGHDIPVPTILQRYGRSLRNFWNDYRLLAGSWFAYDNSHDEPELLAAGNLGNAPEIEDDDRWRRFLEVVDNA